MADSDLLQAWKHFRYVIQEKKIKLQRTQLELLSWKAQSPNKPRLLLAPALWYDLGQGM